MLNDPITAIYHHPANGYEIITQELWGRLLFWRITDNYGFEVYHTVYGETHPPLSIIAYDHILFPQNYKVRILKLDNLKCVAPTSDLCYLVDWQFGNHTTLFPIDVNNQQYVISGYTTGGIIIREFKPGGTTKRFEAVRPSIICSMAYNREKQELIISDNTSGSLGVIHVCTDEVGNLELHIQQDIVVGGGSSILTIEPRNIYLLCGRDYGTIKILNRKSSESLPISPVHVMNSIQVITCSPAIVQGWDNYVFALAYTNGFISLWTFDNYVQYIP